MPINKVDFAGQTLIDLTKDTVTAASLLQGITAHDKAGNAISGTASGPKPEQEKEITITENGDYPITPDVGKVLSKVLAKVNVSGGGGGGGKPLSKYGTFTPAQDINAESNEYGGGYIITHNLGTRPKAIILWESNTGETKGTVRILGMIYSSEYSNGRVEFWTNGALQADSRESYHRGFCTIPPAKCNEKDIAVGFPRSDISFKAGTKYNWRVTA